MQKFTKIMGLTWFFTEDVNEIPDNIKAEITKEAGINFEHEKILAACFVNQIMQRGKLFVVVTKERIVAKKMTSLQQNYFADLTGAKRSISHDIVLLSAGNKSDMFSMMEMPKKACIDLLFEVINNHIMKIRSSDNPANEATDNSDTKECPECAETVKAKAKKCRYCGYQFE